jgi:hypothetical protein
LVVVVVVLPTAFLVCNPVVAAIWGVLLVAAAETLVMQTFRMQVQRADQ